MLQLAGLWEPLRPAAQAALSWAARYHVQPVITSVKRSWEEQAALYNRYQRALADGTFGRPGGLQYPANPPGQSAHGYGLAWDSWVPPEFMGWWAAVRSAYGWRVPPNDLIHAELPAWRAYLRWPGEAA